MNILGCALCCIFGAIFFAASKIVKRNGKYEDYSKFPVTMGKIWHMEDFFGNRWIVSFTNEKGEEVLGMDDVISTNTIHPDKYNIPKVWTMEKIYFWKYDSRGSCLNVSNKEVKYYIHFCNESYYNMGKDASRKSSVVFMIVGIIIMILGFIVLFFAK